MNANQLVIVFELIGLRADIPLIVVHHQTIAIGDGVMGFNPIVEQRMQIEVQGCAQRIRGAYRHFQRHVFAAVHGIALRIRYIGFRYLPVTFDILVGSRFCSQGNKGILFLPHGFSRRDCPFRQFTAHMHLEHAGIEFAALDRTAQVDNDLGHGRAPVKGFRYGFIGRLLGYSGRGDIACHHKTCQHYAAKT